MHRAMRTVAPIPHADEKWPVALRYMDLFTDRSLRIEIIVVVARA